MNDNNLNLSLVLVTILLNGLVYLSTIACLMGDVVRSVWLWAYFVALYVLQVTVSPLSNRRNQVNILEEKLNNRETAKV